ncbi:24058_t:CDS:2 [Entrophospora sp. SA101]|nr:24058_t:CDS:2 [Entrophospora sp. SA101]
MCPTTKELGFEVEVSLIREHSLNLCGTDESHAKRLVQKL